MWQSLTFKSVQPHVDTCHDPTTQNSANQMVHIIIFHLSHKPETPATMAPSFTHLTKPPSATSEHTIADRNCVWQQPRRWITMDNLVIHIAPTRPRHSCRKFASSATLLSHQNKRQINVHLRARTYNLYTTTASFHNTYNQHAYAF